MAKGIKTGGRRKGSKNKAAREVREAARQYTEPAIKTLVTIMQNKKEAAFVRVMAAEKILDRGWGKANQPISGSGGGPVGVALQIVTGVPRGDGGADA